MLSVGDIRLQAVTADRAATLQVSYEIASAPVAPFVLGFYRSADETFQASDESLGTVTVNSPADLTVGPHTRTFTIGSGAGQVALPGAGAVETSVEYFILGVADPADAIPEQDANPTAEDNTAVLSGAYHSSAAVGDVFVLGTVGADSVTINSGSLQLSLNGRLFSYTDATVTGFRIRTYAGDDTIDASLVNKPIWVHGGTEDDTLIGGRANDTLIGGLGNDALSGGPADDTLIGGAGDDSYHFDTDENLGHDTIIDSAGEEFLWFGETTTQAVVVDWSQAGPQVVNANLTLTLSAGDSIEEVVGGSLDDTLIGNDLSNLCLRGGPGNDLLIGGAGDDYYWFEADEPLGSDTIVDGSGVDGLWFPLTMTQPIHVDLSLAGPQIVNSNLTLTLSAGDAMERVTGGYADDTIIGNGLDNWFDGGSGNDILLGGGGNDSLNGDDGRDLLVGGGGSDTLFGGADEDILIASPTSYFDEQAHVVDTPALASLMAEWTRLDADYLTRVDHLLHGTGPNAPHRLDASTVLEDGAADTS